MADAIVDRFTRLCRDVDAAELARLVVKRPKALSKDEVNALVKDAGLKLRPPFRDFVGRPRRARPTASATSMTIALGDGRSLRITAEIINTNEDQHGS